MTRVATPENEDSLLNTAYHGTHLPDAPDGRSRGNFEAIRNANEADGLHIDPRTIVPDWGGEEIWTRISLCWS